MQLVPERSSLPRLLVIPFGLMALVGACLAWFAPDTLLRFAHCPLRDMTGLPCPTCGSTTAAIAMVQGRWTDGFVANPLVALAVIALGIWIVWGVLATIAPGLRRTIVLGSGTAASPGPAPTPVKYTWPPS